MNVSQFAARQFLLDAVTGALEEARGHNRFRGKWISLPSGLLVEFQARGPEIQPRYCLARWQKAALVAPLASGMSSYLSESTEAAAWVNQLLAAYTSVPHIETHAHRAAYK